MRPENPSNEAMPVDRHLAELKSRLIKILLIVLSGTVLAGIYSKEIFGVLAGPLVQNMPAGTGLLALSPIEGWMVYLKVSLVAALFATAPLWFYQVWAFLQPALHKKERRTVAAIVLLSSLFFVSGGVFCYLVVLPAGFKYLMDIYSDTNIMMLPHMQWYFSFLLRALLAFGAAFETPLFMILLSRLGIVSSDKMRRTRKYAIVGIFIFAAIMTPGPDVFSQIALALPLALFYEAGVVGSRLAEGKRNRTVVTERAI